jgi:predicted ester cyclase
VIDIMRIAEGQFVEHWGVMDQMAMMQQLGVIPEPGQV